MVDDAKRYIDMEGRVCAIDIDRRLSDERVVKRRESGGRVETVRCDGIGKMR